ncbi:YbjN domain-containing protein [Mongoliitalea daihaiensis]|uniref:YbjN domain-containing protein n=1 Tax=Mongoliitalea daihaiensis TaxID=2782006 RepID=UPI001F28DB25|nr:YbjN domain-containing protein [Mongoliitalea daihaiensis]UJP66059.1 molecular chaperone Tir [Mongoliitalea daihaiensis]
MDKYFKIVKDYILELGSVIQYESELDNLLVIENEDFGVKNMVIGVATPIIIIEQYLFNVKDEGEIFKQLLIKNRDIVHGAFVLDETGEKVIFRNTLQAETLDLKELESTINSLGLLLSEYSNEILSFSK